MQSTSNVGAYNSRINDISVPENKVAAFDDLKLPRSLVILLSEYVQTVVKSIKDHLSGTMTHFFLL